MSLDSLETKEIDSNPSTRRPPTSINDEEAMAHSNSRNVGIEIQRAKKAYEEYVESFEEKPRNGEVFGWYFYGFCSYFIQTFLIPILFSMIVAQTLHLPPQPLNGWNRSYKRVECNQKQMQLYERLIHRSIKINNSIHLSPLEWTSFSWILGLILAAPLLTFLATILDSGRNPQVFAGIATATGAIFCLPAGFFNTRWIFPPYIALIVVASTVGTSFQSRYLGLMIHAFVGPTKNFSNRRSIAGFLSLYSTAIGSLGAAIVSAFVFYMLRKSDDFTSLWVVSIFSGLIWLIGIAQIFGSNRDSSNTLSDSSSISHLVSIFNYPFAIGSVVGVFLSSFSTMCIFTAGLLYAVGDICIDRYNLLYLWLLYFMFPILSLPLSQQLQKILTADAVKMQLFGLLLSALTSGFAFYFRQDIWQTGHVLLFSAIQTTATGILYAFGRILVLDCCPEGKEGAFSVWFSWTKTLGTCAGFAFASAIPRHVNWSFGVAFWTAILGVVVLIFGNIDNVKGAKSAGNVVVVVVDQHDEGNKSTVGFESVAATEAEKRSSIEEKLEV